MNTIKKEHKEFIDDLLKKIKSNIPDECTLEIAILKGHILLEYYMDKIIELLSESDINISKTNFTFKHKVDILKILGITPDYMNTYDVLLKFNSIRNQLAHRLEFDRVKVDDFILLAMKSTSITKESITTDEQRAKMIRLIIPYLTGYISTTFSMKSEMKVDKK